jgi:hypothetical protein
VSVILSLGIQLIGVVSFMLQLLHPQGKSAQYALNKRLAALIACLDDV